MRSRLFSLIPPSNQNIGHVDDGHSKADNRKQHSARSIAVTDFREKVTCCYLDVALSSVH